MVGLQSTGRGSEIVCDGRYSTVLGGEPVELSSTSLSLYIILPYHCQPVWAPDITLPTGFRLSLGAVH